MDKILIAEERTSTIRIEIKGRKIEIDSENATYEDIYKIAINLLHLTMCKLPQDSPPI
jgi:hypothetical protein